MGNKSDTSVLKWFGIVLAVIIGLLIIVKIIFPLCGVGLGVLWGLSGIIAFLLRLGVFIALFIAAILGIIMLVSWLIREFAD